jgi:adenylate kinase
VNLVLIGPQGSGKGTQAELLVKKFGLIYFSGGEVFRELAKQKTALGRQINEIVNKRGELVPDNLTLEVLNDFVARKDLSRGILFDGYPRNLTQAKLLDRWLAQKSLKIDKVIYLIINRQESIRRLGSRLICPKCEAVFNTLTRPPKSDQLCDFCVIGLIRRVDDQPAAIIKRLAIFQKETIPLIDFYQEKGFLAEINGARPIEVIFEDILRRLPK